ncbi:MAG: winged helix-turn-helix domain-containing tetratricopeptide repeat protein, partial [Proteobacteria bacterium]|nr:winged helix-turn-helix domain-containing tetratricopeptide repeat protein [Pseudomonadota bacterium]
MLYKFGEYELDTGRHEFRVEGRLRDIEPQVFHLIRHLVENRDRLVSRDELIEIVWKGRIVSDSTIDARIHAARKAVDDDGRRQTRIKTVPRRGYRFTADVDVVLDNYSAASGNDDAGGNPLSLSDRPSIAVLPFANISDDPEQDHFADGITEDVITALARFRSLFVIARTSSFTYKGHAVDVTQVADELGVRYVVEGSVRKVGDRVRITAQLIDATTGIHLWADRFDSGLDDVFDLQDRITEQIVVAVEPEIATHERERARRKPPGNLDAWELLQRGLSHFYRINETDRTEAIRLFREAVALDPEFSAAHAHLAYALWASRSVTLDYSEDTEKAAALARAAAEKAVSLDPNEPMAHFALGRLHIYSGEVDMAIGEMQTAISINPNFSRGHHGLGQAYYYCAGQMEQALPHFDAALRLSPRSPMRWITLMIKGNALRSLGRHDEAIAICRQACQFPDVGFLPFMHLAAALAEAGRECAARAAT